MRPGVAYRDALKLPPRRQPELILLPLVQIDGIPKHKPGIYRRYTYEMPQR